MIDQLRAEELTHRIQDALLAGDEREAKRLAREKSFRDLCRALGVRPSEALQTIRECLAAEKGETG